MTSKLIFKHFSKSFHTVNINFSSPTIICMTLTKTTRSMGTFIRFLNYIVKKKNIILSVLRTIRGKIENANITFI